MIQAESLFVRLLIFNKLRQEAQVQEVCYQTSSEYSTDILHFTKDFTLICPTLNVFCVLIFTFPMKNAFFI